MSQRDNVFGAATACAASLPIVLGVGWVADIIARGFIAGIITSKGLDVPEAVLAPIFPKMVWSLLAMWAVTCGIVMLLAWAGLLGYPTHRAPQPPFPQPPWRDDDGQRQE